MALVGIWMHSEPSVEEEPSVPKVKPDEKADEKPDENLDGERLSPDDFDSD